MGLADLQRVAGARVAHLVVRVDLLGRVDLPGTLHQHISVIPTDAIAPPKKQRAVRADLDWGLLAESLTAGA